MEYAAHPGVRTPIDHVQQNELFTTMTTLDFSLQGPLGLEAVRLMEPAGPWLPVGL